MARETTARRVCPTAQLCSLEGPLPRGLLRGPKVRNKRMCCECAAALVAVRNVRFETVPAHMQVRPGTIPQSEDGEHTYGRQAVPFSRSNAGGVRRIFQDHSRYPTGSGALRGSLNQRARTVPTQEYRDRFAYFRKTMSISPPAIIQPSLSVLTPASHGAYDDRQSGPTGGGYYQLDYEGVHSQCPSRLGSGSGGLVHRQRRLASFASGRRRRAACCVRSRIVSGAMQFAAGKKRSCGRAIPHRP